MILIVPLLIPIPPLKGLRHLQELVDPDSRFIKVNDLQIHYKMVGTGQPALILLHGFAASLFSWHKVIGPLSKEHQVVAFDRPAFGLSDRPIHWTGESPYRPKAQAQLTIGLMDKLGIQKVILVGNSAGGNIAALTALLYPERIQSLILVDPAIYVTGGAPAWIRPMSKLPQFQRLGTLFVRNIQKWGNDLGRSAWHDPEKITPETWEGYQKALQMKNWDKALWLFTAHSSESGAHQHLNELKLPVLVITGDDDRIVPTEQSVRLSKELPSTELAVIPHCGHVPHEECPEVFLEVVNHFLNQNQ